ncbi:MAG: thymidylate synthase [Patescibacteria group bacterium]|jgi:thymidylate synthase
MQKTKKTSKKPASKKTQTKVPTLDLSNWPLLYKDILIKGNLESSIAVCTLWTEREAVAKLIKNPKLYSVIGNLYSGQGVNAIIRNVMANPRIRTIVLWGAELSLSGHSLLQFVKEGIDKENKIIQARGEIEKEIDGKAIEAFRKNIEIIDLRGKPATELTKVLESLPQKPPFANKVRTFPPSQPVVKPLPSEQVGFRVEGPTVAQTWLKVINEIYKYGRYKHTRYTQQNELKEVLNMVAVVDGEDPDNEYFPAYLPFDRAELTAYYPEMTSPRRIPGTAYNYGHRMMSHFGLDQIEMMKKLLKNRPDSKKMLAITTDPALDWSNANNGDTPCLVMALGSVQDNKFFFTAHFRSQDMVHGWPRNAFGLRKLQKQIADYGGYEMGKLSLITHSAHIYSDDFKLVETILMDNYEKELGFTPAVHFEFDPRGNVVIDILPKEKLIKATLFEPNGGPPIKEWTGKTATEMIWKLSDWNYISMPSHAMYVGTELQRAEYCLKHNLKYHQDPAPNTADL